MTVRMHVEEDPRWPWYLADGHYHVNMRDVSCDCPHDFWRQAGKPNAICQHIKAVRTYLKEK